MVHPSSNEQARTMAPPLSRAQGRASTRRLSWNSPRMGVEGPGGASWGCEGTTSGTTSAEEWLHLPPEPCGTRGLLLLQRHGGAMPKALLVALVAAHSAGHRLRDCSYCKRRSVRIRPCDGWAGASVGFPFSSRKLLADKRQTNSIINFPRIIYNVLSEEEINS